MSTQNPIEEKIIARAVKDAAFRQALLANPHIVVARELGVTLPANFTIKVIEDTVTTLHIVLPPSSTKTEELQELQDEELEGAAGGSWKPFTTMVCTLIGYGCGNY